MGDIIFRACRYTWFALIAWVLFELLIMWTTPAPPAPHIFTMHFCTVGQPCP